MNKVKYAVLIMMLILGVSAIHAQDSKANAVITLERTACFGSCPIYTVSVLEDGTVLYNGEKFVTTTGEQTYQIDPATVKLMVDGIANAGYFDWKDEYTTMTVTDMPTVITSVTRDGVTKTITRYQGDDSAPIALPYIENWIDLMANTGMWTGAQLNMSAGGPGMDAPVATIQHDPCFGMCPVYNAALFADGTIVYMGIANVPNIGVIVYKTEPDIIESIGLRADSLGYFNWNDRYDTMLMTDQSYVTSSVRYGDKFKQILRYDGDPNAPIGVKWVEDIIDTTVSSVMGAE